MELFKSSTTALPSISEILPAVRSTSVNEALISTLVVPELETSYLVIPSSSAVFPSSASVISGSRALTRGVDVSPDLSTDSESQGGETDPPAEKKIRLVAESVVVKYRLRARCS